MKQTLNINLTQQLTLSPQLRQSLRLLQISSIELVQEVQQTIENNPLLELESENSFTQSSEITPQEETAIDFDDDKIKQPQDVSLNWQEAFESQRIKTKSINNTNTSDNNPLTNLAANTNTLYEHLHWQIQMVALSEKDQHIGEVILRCLDNDGYLSASLAEIQSICDNEYQIETDEIQVMLSLIKTLEPIGVATSNLQQRLLLQLQHRAIQNKDSDTAETGIAQTIIEQYFDDLVSHNSRHIKQKLKLDDQQFSNAIQLITQLNPRISNDFTNDNHDYITPDIVVKKVNQQWLAKINPANQYKLRINDVYAKLLNSEIDQEGASYIQTNLQQAKDFIKGIMSRYDTLQLVAQAIVDQQKAFFEQGESALKPLILQDIATQLELHESTISRAIAGKYLQAPRGVYPLKFFFSAAIESSKGDSSSATAIRSLIKTMIDNESKQKPLSDNKIAQNLEQQGHRVARRTVAKYRESLHIAPSSQRRSMV